MGRLSSCLLETSSRRAAGAAIYLKALAALGARRLCCRAIHEHTRLRTHVDARTTQHTHILPPPRTGNVARAPEEDRFRRIPLGGAAFQSRVAVVPGAVEFLEACGFQVGCLLFRRGGGVLLANNILRLRRAPPDAAP